MIGDGWVPEPAPITPAFLRRSRELLQADVLNRYHNRAWEFFSLPDNDRPDNLRCVAAPIRCHCREGLPWSKGGGRAATPRGIRSAALLVSGNAPNTSMRLDDSLTASSVVRRSLDGVDVSREAEAMHRREASAVRRASVSPRAATIPRSGRGVRHRSRCRECWRAFSE
jgi:hypothetical protein